MCVVSFQFHKAKTVYNAYKVKAMLGGMYIPALDPSLESTDLNAIHVLMLLADAEQDFNNRKVQTS